MAGALAVALTLSVATADGASAAPARSGGSGSVQVTIETPDGMGAVVSLLGATPATASKPPTGTTATTRLQLGAGPYRGQAPLVQFNGRLFRPDIDPPHFAVRRGSSSRVRVQYQPVQTAQNLSVSSLSQTEIDLSWAAPQGVRDRDLAYRLRRVTGDVAVSRVDRGTAVPVHGTTARDASLAAGQQYSYSLFTRIHGRWTGPLTLSAGTQSPDGVSQAAFIAAPSTLILTPHQVAGESTTGTGVALQLASSVAPPLPGSAVVLPPSSTLAGGFLGVVQTVGGDGHTVFLTPGGIADAFDYYSLDVPDISALATPQVAAIGTAGKALPGALRNYEAALAAPLAAVSPNNNGCALNSADAVVSLSPSLKPGGHFHGTVYDGKVLGLNVPEGATLDLEVTLTATAALKVDATAGVSCGLELPSLMVPLAEAPVPIALNVSPKADITVSGAAQLSNAGVTATAGVRVNGTFDLHGGNSFSGSTILQASPLTPTIEGSAVSVGVKLGGEIAVGPGAGSTTGGGAIAGLGGELDPISGSVEVAESAGPPPTYCTTATFGFYRELNLTAKAWLGHLALEQTVTLPELEGTTQYGNSPWHLPKGCDQQSNGGGDPGGSGGGGTVTPPTPPNGSPGEPTVSPAGGPVGTFFTLSIPGPCPDGSDAMVWDWHDPSGADVLSSEVDLTQSDPYQIGVEFSAQGPDGIGYAPGTYTLQAQCWSDYHGPARALVWSATAIPVVMTAPYTISATVSGSTVTVSADEGCPAGETRVDLGVADANYNVFSSASLVDQPGTPWTGQVPLPSGGSGPFTVSASCHGSSGPYGSAIQYANTSVP